jgi:hypothetical protein
MKTLLVLSLLLNVWLIYLLQKGETTPPLERIIIEEKKFPLPSNKVSPPAEAILTNPSRVASESQTPQPIKSSLGPGEKEIEELVDKVRQDRMDFLREKLSLGDKELDQIEKVKEDYLIKVQSVFPIESGAELSVDQRRRMLELEVGRDQALSRIMGRQKWEKFQKFRKTYNQKKFQENFEESAVVVPLDI